MTRGGWRQVVEGVGRILLCEAIVVGARAMRAIGWRRAARAAYDAALRIED